MCPVIASITGAGINAAPALFRWMTLAQPGVSARQRSTSGSRTASCYPAVAACGMPVAIIRTEEDFMADRDDAVWNTLRGNWNQLKGKVREKWGLLTNDDIEHIGGHKDRLVGKIQERYGKAKWEAANIEDELRKINNEPATTTTTRTTKTTTTTKV